MARSCQAAEYHYGFQGHACPERSRRDARIGRFLSVDPLAGKYPFYSPYAFSENRVVDGVELEGLEVWLTNDGGTAYGPYSPEGAEQAGVEPFLPDRWIDEVVITEQNPISAARRAGEEKAISQYYTQLNSLTLRDYPVGMLGSVIQEGGDAGEAEYWRTHQLVAFLRDEWLNGPIQGRLAGIGSPSSRGSLMPLNVEFEVISTLYGGSILVRQIPRLVVSSAEVGAVVGGRAVLALREAYKLEVNSLSSVAFKLRAAGSSSEEIARTLHGLRRELGVKYKSLTPDDVLQKIYQRNLQKYGDKLGPSIDFLRQQGKSWDDIIESATRPGGKDLGF